MEEQQTPNETGAQPVNEPEQKAQEPLLDLNFIPDWARKPPESRNFDSFEGESERDDRRGRDRDRRRPEGRGGGGGKDKDRRRKSPREGGPGKDRDRDRGGGRRDFRRDERPKREFVELPPVEVRFVPEQNGLSSAVKQIHANRKSYPIMQMASMFLNNPDLCIVKIEPQKGSQGIPMHQCKTCGVLALDSAAIISHILKAHLEEYFDKEEIVGDPPAGQFVCVARCGFSGILLGPPNHHSYAAKLQELHKSRFANMPIEDYKRRIEMRREPELIEQWKEENRKQTFFKLKNAGENPEKMKRQAAEAYLIKNVVPDLIVETRKASIPLKVARLIDDQRLKTVIRIAWNRESRFPISVVLALRGAFRHRGLQVFKGARNVDYVSAVRPAPLDPQHVVESIREVLVFLQQHPGSDRKKLLEALRPGVAPDSPEASGVLSQVTWLVEKGHIIEFFNGTLSLPPKVQPDQPAAKAEEAKPAGGDTNVAS